MKSFSIRQLSIAIGILTALALPLASCSSTNGGSDPGSASNSTTDVPENAVQVGVLVNQDIEFARQRYGGIVEHLSEQIGRPFVLVPLAYESQFLEVERGTVDFIISNPLASVQMRRLYSTELIATQALPGTGTEFSGLIIVKSDSNIRQVPDLKGKKGACVSLETGAGGCLFQILYTQEKGLDPYLDFASLQEIPSQNNIVLAVINGDVDFGFIRTGQLEGMVESGLISDINQVRVLDPRNDGFVYEHTTPLYPTWAVSATSSAQPAIVETVTQALLDLTPDSPALTDANIEGFVAAVDYTQIDQLIEELRLKSWDAQ